MSGPKVECIVKISGREDGSLTLFNPGGPILLNEAGFEPGDNVIIMHTDEYIWLKRQEFIFRNQGVLRDVRRKAKSGTGTAKKAKARK